MYNRAIRTLLVINSIFVFGATLLGPLYVVFVRDEIGGNILDVGWVFAVYMFTVGIASYFVGKLGDRLKEKEYLLALSYLFRAVSFLLFVFVTSITQLFWLQILLGLGEAIGNVSFKALYSLHLNKVKATSQWSAWDMV